MNTLAGIERQDEVFPDGFRSPRLAKFGSASGKAVGPVLLKGKRKEASRSKLVIHPVG
jgi:hypothetical protein